MAKVIYNGEIQESLGLFLKQEKHREDDGLQAADRKQNKTVAIS
jgi:hypothetical protein